MKLYTTHCPKCKVLEKKMALKGIEYEEEDNIDEIMKVAAKAGVNSTPLLETDDGRILDFAEANRLLNS